jgi:hypothetical protein
MYPFSTPTVKFTFNFIFKLSSLIDGLLKKVVIPPFDRYFKVSLLVSVCNGRRTAHRIIIELGNGGNLVNSIDSFRFWLNQLVLNIYLFICKSEKFCRESEVARKWPSVEYFRQYFHIPSQQRHTDITKLYTTNVALWRTLINKLTSLPNICQLSVLVFLIIAIFQSVALTETC